MFIITKILRTAYFMLKFSYSHYNYFTESHLVANFCTYPLPPLLQTSSCRVMIYILELCTPKTILQRLLATFCMKW